MQYQRMQPEYPSSHVEELADVKCFQNRDSMVGGWATSYLAFDNTERDGNGRPLPPPPLTMAARFMRAFAQFCREVVAGNLIPDVGPAGEAL
eukprot:2501283-Pyramimonas_sp.AAC.1